MAVTTLDDVLRSIVAEGSETDFKDATSWPAFQKDAIYVVRYLQNMEL